MSGSKQNVGFGALRNELKREREKSARLSKEVEELTEKLAALQDEETLYRYASENEFVKNKIIHTYLATLSARPNVSLSGSNGYTVLTPVNRPKNLADAKRLADKIIKY